MVKLPKRFQRHETKFALLMVWGLGPVILTLLGFYLGTIFGNRTHEFDLQTGDIHNGVITALGFLAAALLVALIVTAVIPDVVEKDYATREERWAHRGDHDHH